MDAKTGEIDRLELPSPVRPGRLPDVLGLCAFPHACARTRNGSVKSQSSSRGSSPTALPLTKTTGGIPCTSLCVAEHWSIRTLWSNVRP